MITFEIAKKYVDRHWSVFPIILSLDDKGKVQKKPAIAWREYQERLPTDEELHRWFDKPQYNGIGVATGELSGIVVVDEDRAIGNEFYSSMQVKTISGGKHYYFKWTEELRNDSAINDKPLDFRGDGGFVVLPPSTLGSQTYSWLKDIEPMYLSPVPEKLKALLKIRKQQPINKPFFRGKNLGVDGLPVANEGNRNMTATRVAGIICSQLGRKLLSIYGFRLFKDWNRTHCSPPLDDQELSTTWQSIFNAELRKPTKETDYIVVSGSEAMEQYKRLQQNYGLGVETGFDLLDEYFKFLPEQLYLLSAPTHHGKTTLALNIAARIASVGHRVFFGSLEQGVFIAPRVETILGGAFPETLSLLETAQTVSVEKLITIIEEMVERPQLVCIDHLHFLKKSGKGATEDIDEMIIALQNMAKKLHVPILVIAHVRKLNGERPPELDDLRDSSSLSQVPSVVMLMYRKKNEQSNMVKSYLSNAGVLFIAKNRIQGRTGVLRFSIENSGEFRFAKGYDN